MNIKNKILITGLILSTTAQPKNLAFIMGGGGETSSKNMFFKDFIRDEKLLTSWGWQTTIAFDNDKNFGDPLYDEIKNKGKTSKFEGEKSLKDYLTKALSEFSENESGQLLLRINTHGSDPNEKVIEANANIAKKNDIQANAAARTHAYSVGENDETKEEFSDDDVKKMIMKFNEKRPNVKISIMDDSCFSGTAIENFKNVSDKICYAANTTSGAVSRGSLLAPENDVMNIDKRQDVSVEEYFLNHKLKNMYFSFQTISSNNSKFNNELSKLIDHTYYSINERYKPTPQKYYLERGNNFFNFATRDSNFNKIEACQIQGNMKNEVEKLDSLLNDVNSLDSELLADKLFAKYDCSIKKIEKGVDAIKKFTELTEENNYYYKSNKTLLRKFAEVYGSTADGVTIHGKCDDHIINLMDHNEFLKITNFSNMDENNKIKNILNHIANKQIDLANIPYIAQTPTLNPCDLRGMNKIIDEKISVLQKDAKSSKKEIDDLSAVKDGFENFLKSTLSKEEYDSWLKIGDEYEKIVDELSDQGHALEIAAKEYFESTKCLYVIDYIKSRKDNMAAVKPCSDFVLIPGDKTQN